MCLECETLYTRAVSRCSGCGLSLVVKLSEGSSIPDSHAPAPAHDSDYELSLAYKKSMRSMSRPAPAAHDSDYELSLACEESMRLAHSRLLKPKPKPKPRTRKTPKLTNDAELDARRPKSPEIAAPADLDDDAVFRVACAESLRLAEIERLEYKAAARKAEMLECEQQLERMRECEAKAEYESKEDYNPIPCFLHCPLCRYANPHDLISRGVFMCGGDDPKRGCQALLAYHPDTNTIKPLLID